MSPRRLAPLLCIAGAVALTLAGPGSEISRATTVAPDSDTQLAKRSLLTLDDFPASWEQVKKPDMRVFCPAYTDARRNASGVGQSPQFAQGSLLEAAAAVYLYADDAAAARAFRAISSRATRRCYIDETTKALADGGASEVRDVRVRRLSLGRLGDQRAGARFIFPLTAAGVELDLNIDLTYVRRGRALSLVFCLKAGGAFDSRLRRDLVAKQAGRLAA